MSKMILAPLKVNFDLSFLTPMTGVVPLCWVSKVKWVPSPLSLEVTAAVALI